MAFLLLLSGALAMFLAGVCCERNQKWLMLGCTLIGALFLLSLVGYIIETKAYTQTASDLTPANHGLTQHCITDLRGTPVYVLGAYSHCAVDSGKGWGEA